MSFANHTKNIKTMKRYFAKPNTWFKEGTECFREDEMWPSTTLSDNKGNSTGSAIYRGTYIVGSCNPDGYDKFWYKKGFVDGQEVEMREHCCDDEFDVVEE
jgi:hypothetical protein